MDDDGQLLRRYVNERSQDAFAELVHRHLDLVYFAALRRVGGDAHLADDVAQSVFSDLARKAPALLGRPVLAGWLYTSTRFAAAQAVRTERRRRTHEQEAQTMRELNASPNLDWEKVRPVIDEALDELADHEREAVLLRFFENRPLAEVGARFSLTADAARMRIERALDKLRSALARRGVASTSTALMSAFVTQSGFSAPAGLAVRVVSGALGGSGGGAVAIAWWKLAAVVSVAGVAGVGVWFYARPAADGRNTPAAVIAAYATEPATSTAAAPADVVEALRVAPVEAASANPPAATTPPVSRPVETVPGPMRPGFAGILPMGKEILKVFWERAKLSRDPIVGRWAFRPGAGSAFQPEFELAVESLRSAGWVKIGPKGGVLLTEAGATFSAAHAAELEDVPVPRWARRLLLPDFEQLSPAARGILKTLVDHQAVTPDQPPKRWGFRLRPGSPDESEFLGGVAELQGYGVAAVGAKSGVVMLTALGDVYCRDQADAIAAEPAKARVFQHLGPNAPAAP
jgi:RNA polymerase sigma factor (sigma-70 family)